MKKLTDHIESIQNKTVIVRCNFDVPIKDGQVTDTTRIEDALSTIKLLLKGRNKISLIAHYDRPHGKYDPEKSLQPVSIVLKDLLNHPVEFTSFSQMKSFQRSNQSVVLFDNLRFFKEEKDKNKSFAQSLSNLGQIFVNECFATSHRDHASITLLPHILPGYLGLSFSHELKVLNQILTQPKHPLVLVLGGAKIETKEPMIERFKDIADKILVGGKIALDMQKLSSFPPNVILANLTPSGKDITSASAEKFAHSIENAGTVIWNGTMGIFEESEHQQGTRLVAEAVNSTNAFTLVGGGDTESALTLLNQENNISHISSGGGAMLSYLSTHSLIGINALK